MLLVGNRKTWIDLKFFHYMVLFLPSIKYFVHKIVIQFNNTTLVVEQNIYVIKTVSAFIIFDLDIWPKIPLRNFTLKNCLFGATNRAKDSDKEKWMYSGYEIAFYGKRSWNFGNGFATNAVIFVLIIVHHLILVISRIILIFILILLVLMQVLVDQRKCLVLILVK